MIEVLDHTGMSRPQPLILLGADEARPRGVRRYARYMWTETLPSGPLGDPLALDLIEVVRAVHLADRAVRRSPLLGKRLRRIELSVWVRQPRLWREVAAAVEALANFASADEWRINFHSVRNRASRPQRSGSAASVWNVIALFSGGLDSLCGAAYRASRGERVLFVTHSPPGVKRAGALIGDVWQALHPEPSTAGLASFRLRPMERGPRGTRNMFHEHTRRSRPFYFLGLASAIAVETGVPLIQMSENGALGQSLPYRYDSHGGTLARQAHAHMLAGFAALLDAIAPRAGGWRVENPLETMTKGEACRLLGPARSLASRSVSCEYVGRQAAALRRWRRERRGSDPAAYLGEGPQCGACLPCVVRRAALLAAGIDDPDSGYFFDARDLGYWQSLQAHDRPSLFARVEGHPFYLRQFCRRILDMTLSNFAVQFLPELRLAPHAMESESTYSPVARYGMMQRYARELLAFLDGRPTQSRRKTTKMRRSNVQASN